MTTSADPTTSVRTLVIDKTHSEVTFQVRHLMTRVRGRFTDFSGTIDFNQAQPDRSSVAFTINTASVDTGTPDRDTHLRTDDFFSSDKYPTMTFVSSRVTKKDDEHYDVTGTLTIRDVAKEITLPVTHLGEAKDPWGNARLGFELDITINRKDFGLVWNTALEIGGFVVGDDVTISVSVQAIAQ